MEERAGVRRKFVVRSSQSKLPVCKLFHKSSLSADLGMNALYISGVVVRGILICIICFLLVYKTKVHLGNITFSTLKTWSPLKRYYVACLSFAIPLLVASSLFDNGCRGTEEAAVAICQSSLILLGFSLGPVMLAFVFSVVFAYERLFTVLAGKNLADADCRLARVPVLEWPENSLIGSRRRNVHSIHLAWISCFARTLSRPNAFYTL